MFQKVENFVLGYFLVVQEIGVACDRYDKDHPNHLHFFGVPVLQHAFGEALGDGIIFQNFAELSERL